NSDPTEPPDAVCLYRHANIQQLLPESLRRLFEQDVERRTHEALCVLYVALTRAIHGLYMLIASSDRAPAKTFAGLRRASLADNADAVAGSILFETGDKNWMRKSIQRESHGSVPEAKDHQPAKSSIRFAPALLIPSRSWQRETPSQRETGTTR